MLQRSWAVLIILWLLYEVSALDKVLMKIEENWSKQLADKVELVKWESRGQERKFNLLTVHSLIVDDNPKFIELKALIHNYNETPHHKLDRPTLRTAFAGKLYTMLCELIRIPNMENQLRALDKVYSWAGSNITVLENGDEMTNDENASGNLQTNKKIRPTTASTKTRPFSAHSRPFSGVSRAPVSKMTNPSVFNENSELKREFSNVDYERLKLGER